MGKEILFQHPQHVFYLFHFHNRFQEILETLHYRGTGIRMPVCKRDIEL